jgi:plastocyanin
MLHLFGNPLSKVSGARLVFLIVTLLLVSFQTEEPGEPGIPGTGDEAFIMVEDQTIQSATITVAEVVIPDQGWVVIHADRDGAPGAVVGYEPAPAGRSIDLVVGIDTQVATETMHAMLHIDAGVQGEFDFPGPDEPLTVNGQIIMDRFRVSYLTEEPPIQPPDPIEPVQVQIIGSRFEPGELTVVAGTIVMWVHEGNINHTVTSDQLFFDSGVLRAGERYEFTFREVGTFPYYCQFHGGPGGSGMSGTITVVEPES